ncbi:helix-hairpin-helix domain-containing protein [Wukongibacter baidiensis]|uniref:helix-hairpin-helix domain-containing protein n=1 Tax=Wukongibacter baidiensis TaxID=1723361 RepID=UPI003D7F9C7B
MRKIRKKEVVLVIIFILSIIFFNVKEFRFKTNEKALIEADIDIEQEKVNTDSKENITEESQKKVEDPREIKVDICGAVKSQGVVILKEGDRVIDAINKAGGLTDNADINRINRSKYVSDGEKIIIPEKGQEIESLEDLGSLGVDTKININTASKEELITLDGIGESIGERIIKYRRENNGFKSIEDIMKVSGIGESKFNQIKDSIKVK